MSKADHITTTDDPATLRAMIAERDAEIDRLQHIIVAMQRHRFGKKAETLPTDQLLLALEDVEQVEAEGLARDEAADETKREARTRTLLCTTWRGFWKRATCPAPAAAWWCVRPRMWALPIRKSFPL